MEIKVKLLKLDGVNFNSEWLKGVDLEVAIKQLNCLPSDLVKKAWELANNPPKKNTRTRKK
jgi:hypothetical protein